MLGGLGASAQARTHKPYVGCAKELLRNALVLCLLAPSGSSSDQQSSDEEESLVEEVPVSTIILVAKSFFFRKMFTGSFREGGGNNSVEVRIAKEGPSRDPEADVQLMGMSCILFGNQSTVKECWTPLF